MLDIEKILLEWQSDSVINDNKLDQTSVNTAKLHAKYLQWLSLAKLQLKKAQMNQKSLLKDKWLYYNGKMSQDEIKLRGWDYDPFDGLKVMKNDMQLFFNSDEDLQKAKAKIEYLKVTIDFLKECMQNITWRHQTIKNTIDWRKFMAGQ